MQMMPCSDLEGGAAANRGFIWKTLDILFGFYKEDNYIFTSFIPNCPKVMLFLFLFKGMDDKNATKLNELIQVG